MIMDSSNKISIFMPTLAGGGAERVMLNLAIGFSEKGKNVDLIVTKLHGNLKNSIPANINVINLDVSRTIKSINKLAKYIRSQKPAIVFSALNNANLAAIIANLISCKRTRVAITLHGSLPYQNKFSFMSWSYHLMFRVFFRYADEIVAVSAGVAAEFEKSAKLPPGKIKVIYNPVINEELLCKASVPCDHQWFRPGEPPVVISVGRLSCEKNYSVLIKAIAQIIRTRQVRLMILGEGDERPKLETLINEMSLNGYVSLEGYVYNPYQYMSRSAVFALSSLREGLPTALIEAMACGIPVVSTNCPSGPEEILQGGRLGRLVPVGNVEYLADAIINALDECSSRCSIDDLNEYKIDYAVTRYLKLIEV